MRLPKLLPTLQLPRQQRKIGTVDGQKQKPPRRTTGGHKGAAKSAAAMTQTGAESWTERTERERGPGIESEKGMPHAHKNLTERGGLTGRRKGTVTSTAVKTGTVTGSGNETGSVIEKETERGTGTERERRREIVTATGIVRKTTAAMTRNIGDGTAAIIQMTKGTLLICWKGKSTASRRSAKEMAVESGQRGAGHLTRIAVATTETSCVNTNATGY